MIKLPRTLSSQCKKEHLCLYLFPELWHFLLCWVDILKRTFFRKNWKFEGQWVEKKNNFAPKLHFQIFYPGFPWDEGLRLRTAKRRQKFVTDAAEIIFLFTKPVSNTRCCSLWRMFTNYLQHLVFVSRSPIASSEFMQEWTTIFIFSLYLFYIFY